MGSSRRIKLAVPRLLAFALLTTLGALFLRLPTLSDRPFHTDEAVNAFILQDTMERGFAYRAEDHHGPTLYLLSAAALRPFGIVRLAQMDEWMLRLIPAVCGALLSGVVYLFFPYMRAAGAIASSVFFAVLAPFVYYSGEFIHESLLVLLLALYCAALWRTLRTGRLAWAIASGIAAGLMLATKETAGPILLIVTASAVGGALLGPLDDDVVAETRLRQAGLPARRRPPPARVRSAPMREPARAAVAAPPHEPASSQTQASRVRRGLGTLRSLLAVVVVALLVVLLVFSSFGRHPSHAFDLFQAVGAQIARGTGAEHAYPWWQYGVWCGAPSPAGIPWSGWLLPPLAAFGAWVDRHRGLTRALGFSTVGLFVFFSALPYKTPWLMLAWEFPLVLLAGIGFAYLSDRAHFATGIAALLILALFGHETLNRCHRFAADPANPLAYAPSSPDLRRLVRDIDNLAAASGAGKSMLIQVVARDYWPLPWVARKYNQVGFWSDPPTQLNSGAVLLGPEYVDHFDGVKNLRPYTLRPGVYIFLGDL